MNWKSIGIIYSLRATPAPSLVWSSEGVKRYWADNTWCTDWQTDRPTDSCKTICPLFQGGHKNGDYTLSNFSDLLNVVSFFNLCKFFADKCLKMKLLIDLCTVLCRIFFKNAQVSIYFLADLNIDDCEEFTFLLGKLDIFLMLPVLKWVFKTYCILKVRVKVDSTLMRIVL